MLQVTPSSEKRVKQALNLAFKRSKDGARAGLYAAGLIVQRRAQQHTPVEYGNLRASAYTRVEGNKVVVGFSAAYAVYVHENLEQKLKGQPRPSGLGVYWGPQGQPKFLERAMNETKGEVLRVVGEMTGQSIPDGRYIETLGGRGRKVSHLAVSPDYVPRAKR